MASEATVVGALFVDPGGDVDGEIPGLLRFPEGAGNLDAINHAHGAVQPTASRLGVAVRSDQQRLAGIPRSSDDVADAVDAGLETGFGHSSDQPAPRFHIHRRQRWPNDPWIVGAKGSEMAQVVDQAVGVDLNHVSDFPRTSIPHLTLVRHGR